MDRRCHLLSRSIAVFTAAGLFLAGCGDGEAPGPESPAPPAPLESETSSQDPAPDDATTELYFTTGEQFRKVSREIPVRSNELIAVTEALIEGPTAREEQADAEAQTQIPATTEVEDISLHDGVATVALSGNFTAGIPDEPGARSEIEQQDLNARLAQVTFTLTQFERVDKAKILAGGEPVKPAQTLLSRANYAEPAEGPVRRDRPRGAQTKSTEQIQKRLAALRYLPKSAVDGVAGYRTQQAVLAFQSWEGLDRDGVVGPATTAALAEARIPNPKRDGRRIEVYRDKGVVLLVKGGVTQRAIHASSGAAGYETPTGSFEVFRKELKSWSVPYSVWLPYASYFNAGIAFHESPDVPTFPASHGCVRLPAPEAKIVYRFASLGTAVEVF